MNRYNMFQAIVMSFYSKNLYRDVATNWGGKTFLYLLLVLALSWLPITFLIQHGLNEANKRISTEELVKQIPVLTIRDGKLSTPENRPYIITNPSSKETIAIIDTSGKYKTIEEANAPILITETQFISHPKSGETKINEVPKNLDYVIDPHQVKAFVDKYIGYFWILLFLFFTLCSFLYRLIQALLYALIGRIGSALFGYNLNYDRILHIALVAVTPPILVATLLELIGVNFPYIDLFYFLLAMFYLFYGMSANRVKTDGQQ